MSFQAVDSILGTWARKHGLSIATVYRDEEVRSIELVDRRGDRYQIWIDPPDALGLVGIHAWDFRHLKTHVQSSVPELESNLDGVRETVLGWMAGHGG